MANKRSGAQDEAVDPFDSLHAVRVRIREVPYTVLSKDILGNPMTSQASGYGPGRPEILPANRTDDVDPDEAVKDYELGQLIHLNDADYMRLKNAHCVVDEEDVLTVEDEAGEHVFDIRSATVEEIADVLRESRPNANDTVALSEGDPELAAKLLEAENQASEGEPRQSVLEGLSKVISRN